MKDMEKLVEEGITIVMITHNPEIAARADRCIRIEDGKIAEAEAV